MPCCLRSGESREAREHDPQEEGGHRQRDPLLDGATTSGICQLLLRHRLPPFLGEPFGDCAGLVDVGVVRGALDQPVRPSRHPPIADLEPAVAAGETATLDEHGESHVISEVTNPL